jgi:tetratricopeptide (TPR) repeat protein
MFLAMPSLGLAMIVKNGGADLRPCLESVAGVVAQRVVADTGSSDDTVSVARACGATVLEVPWSGDFAQARNAALAPLATDWVLVLDADEELSQPAREQIPALLAGVDPELGGYLLPIRNYLREEQVYFRSSASVPNRDSHPRARGALSWAEHELCRLFRRAPNIRYQGRVHEVVEHSIRAAGLRLERAECRILHFGQLASDDIRQNKALFYRELGCEKVKQEPANAMAWFELGGIELSSFQQQAAAEQCFLRAVALEPRLLDAWFLLFHLYDQQRRYEHALAVYEKLVAQNLDLPPSIEARCADYWHDRGDLRQACALYRRVLARAPSAALSAASRCVIVSKLGYTEVRLGQWDTGLERLRAAVAQASHIRDNHLRLIRALVLHRQLDLAALAAEQGAACCPDPQLYRRAGALWFQAGQISRAQEVWAAGRLRFPAADPAPVDFVPAALNPAWELVEKRAEAPSEAQANGCGLTAAPNLLGG